MALSSWLRATVRVHLMMADWVLDGRQAKPTWSVGQSADSSQRPFTSTTYIHVATETHLFVDCNMMNTIRHCCGIMATLSLYKACDLLTYLYLVILIWVVYVAVGTVEMWSVLAESWFRAVRLDWSDVSWHHGTGYLHYSYLSPRQSISLHTFIFFLCVCLSILLSVFLCLSVGHYCYCSLLKCTVFSGAGHENGIPIGIGNSISSRNVIGLH